jgi:putative effector of murein hydrolase LrgA (UPF0299 family)
LAHLSLLFVPAGVGVMLHWERVHEHWQALALVQVLGILITLVVTALTMVGMSIGHGMSAYAQPEAGLGLGMRVGR